MENRDNNLFLGDKLELQLKKKNTPYRWTGPPSTRLGPTCRGHPHSGYWPWRWGRSCSRCMWTRIQSPVQPWFLRREQERGSLKRKRKTTRESQNCCRGETATVFHGRKKRLTYHKGKGERLVAQRRKYGKPKNGWMTFGWDEKPQRKNVFLKSHVSFDRSVGSGSL